MQNQRGGSIGGQGCTTSRATVPSIWEVFGVPTSCGLGLQPFSVFTLYKE